MLKTSTSDFRSTFVKVLGLATPALGTLLVVPLLTFTDSALAGFLGTTELAALTLGSTLINFVIGMCVFLTFSTTTLTGKLVGQNQQKLAIHRGSQYIWVGLSLGFALIFCLYIAAVPALSLFSDNSKLIYNTLNYLYPALFLLPGNLGFQAANGILRGLGDTKTPFYISLLGVFINIPFSIFFILVMSFGIAGLSIGTVLSQWVMFLVAAVYLQKQAKLFGTSIRPNYGQMKQLGLGGLALFIRSGFLWGSGLLTVKAAALGGVESVAAHQIVMVLWNISAYTLDAVAIAAQILFAQVHQQKSRAEIKGLIKNLVLITTIFGCLWSGLFLLAPLFWPGLFSANTNLWHLSIPAFIIAGLMQPLVALVYLFDGILMGEGNFWQLAKLYGIIFFFHAPLAIFPYLIWYSGVGGLTLVWLVYAGWLQLIRLLLLSPAIRKLYR